MTLMHRDVSVRHITLKLMSLTNKKLRQIHLIDLIGYLNELYGSTHNVGIR